MSGIRVFTKNVLITELFYAENINNRQDYIFYATKSGGGYSDMVLNKDNQWVNLNFEYFRGYTNPTKSLIEAINYADFIGYEVFAYKK